MVSQSETDGYADPTMMLTATADDKEAIRATKVMGPKWVGKVRSVSRVLSSPRCAHLAATDQEQVP